MEQKDETVKEIEKGLILCGDFATGKSLIVNFFAGAVLDLVYHLDGRKKDLFADKHLFSRLTDEHKFIHIDDVVHLETIEATFPILNQKLVVFPQYRAVHKLDTPRIIITTNLPFEQLKAVSTIFRRYHLVDIAGCGYYSHLNTMNNG